MNIRNIPIGGADRLVLETASVVRDVAAKHGIGAGCVEADRVAGGL